MSRRAVPILLLAGAYACDCSGGDDSLQRLAPKISVDPAMLDFGEVPVGATKRLSLIVENKGSAELVIAKIDTSTVFAADLLADAIPPGQTGVIDVAFSPSGEEVQNGTMLISSNAEETPMVSVPVRGIGGLGFVDVTPLQIQLTGVSVGTTVSAEIVIANTGIEDVAGQVATETFARPEHFSLTGLSRFDAPGPYAVPARRQITLVLQYQPLLSGNDDGRIRVETCGERCGVEVEVLASSSEALLLLDPPAIDFGGVGINTTKNATVLVKNDGDNPVDVTSARIAGSADFEAMPSRELPLTVPGKSSAAINVGFTPSAAGRFTAELVVDTTDPLVAQARVRLSGSGEGPLFEVDPQAIDFGIESRTGTFRRAFLMTNAGSSEVRVTSITIAGQPELALAGLPGLPIRLGAGESATGYVEFSPQSVGEYTAVVTIASSEGRPFNLNVRAGYAERQCQLDLAPARINFGLVPATYSRTRDVRLMNVGTDPCNILSGAFAAPIDPSFRIEAAPWPLSISPGQSHLLRFTYAPADMRPAKGKYAMTTDDPVFPDRAVALVGTSEPYAHVFVLPQQINFGETRPMCTAGVREINVFNSGTLPATIEQIVLTSTTTEIAFSPRTPTPYTLAAGSRAAIRVGYTPQNIGVDRGEVEISVRELPYPFIVPLQGAGSGTPLVRDQFVQSRNRQVDVLFVVDNSCSMFEEQQALATNFASFIRTANILSVDFQIGVTTTDVRRSGPGARGALVGPVITRNTPNYEMVFQQQAVRGVQGSAFEQGLEAMKLAFDHYDARRGHNANLLRQGAQFVFVVVSDEDDQSPANEVTYFQTLRQHAPNGFLTAAVTGEQLGCFGLGGSATDAPKYLSWLRLTNGVSESICTPDWARTLSNLGTAAFGLKRRFILSQPADMARPITVRVNGNVVTMTDYMYDPSDHSIVFTPAGIPPESAVIEVDYTADC